MGVTAVGPVGVTTKDGMEQVDNDMRDALEKCATDDDLEVFRNPDPFNMLVTCS